MKTKMLEKFIVLSFALVALCLPVPANAEIVSFASAVTWRADGEGDFIFKGNGKLSGANIAEDGAVEYAKAPGTYELINPYPTDSLIISLCLTWEFSGKVTMEVSFTGNPSDYMPAINGAPLEAKAGLGKRIKYRAKLEPGSKLTAVRLTYKDITGLSATFGEPKLSGFTFKKPIFIKGQAGEQLFNFQAPITIGSFAKAKNCDAVVKGVVQADFDDARFTSADGETLLPYYIESVTGKTGERVGKFWVKIPQIPKEGLIIYLYYGKLGPELLSDPAKVFDFYYDFTDSVFDDEKWQATGLDEGVIEYKQGADGEITTLDRKTYDTAEKIIEFFKVGKDFKWVRNRKSDNQLPAPAVGKEETAGLSEEIPNLPEFVNTAVAANGDLVLAEGTASPSGGQAGEYTSLALFADFKARILVPEWSEAANGSSLSVAVTADGKNYKKGCENEKYYYASKNDFKTGSMIKWRVNLSRQDKAASSGRFKEFTIDFRPGTISVVAPKGKESIKANSAYQILWSAMEYEPSYKMKLEYSSDAGKNYNVISEGVSNSGKYSWLAPEEASEEAMVKVSDVLEPKVYGVSEGYFSISSGDRGQGTEEEAALEEEIMREAAALKEEETQEKPGGPQLYELLIKVDDEAGKKAKAEPAEGGYKEGDIIMIKPAGYLWGVDEKKKFLIIQANLTAKQAADFMEPKELIKGYDKKGKEIKETLSRRKYKIDLTKQGLLVERDQALRGKLKAKPLVDAVAVEEK